MRRVQFDAGQRIFAQGDASNGAFMVIVGAVEITVDREGRSFFLEQIAPGGIFGEMGLLDRSPRSATAIAKVATTCAAYEADELNDLLRSNPEELLHITRTLIHRLRDTDRKYVELLATLRDPLAD